MNQFLSGSDYAFAELLSAATGHCVRFRGEPMPAGCQPQTTDIGFESPDGRRVSLLVRPLSQVGTVPPEVAEWLRSGARHFASVDAMSAWIRGPLAEAYRGQRAVGDDEHAVTDMARIREALPGLQPSTLQVDGELLAALIGRQVRGQSQAVGPLAGGVARHLARAKPSRPAVLFAVGPSGVGKTRAAESLPGALSQLTDAAEPCGFLRLDMNEYQEAHRVSQLLGAPQGYVGYGDGSQLLDALARQPRTIVLFDEIEKAHPAILRVLMNAMDQGRLSSPGGQGQAREVDCRFAIFVFTSNLRAQEILAEIERRQAWGVSAVEDDVCRRNLLEAQLPPEIVGRIARFLVFGQLDSETRARIIADAIVATAQEYGLDLRHVSPDAVIEVMKMARGLSFGVRPERYFIDELFGPVFAQAVRRRVSGPTDLIGPPFALSPPNSAAGETSS